MVRKECPGIAKGVGFGKELADSVKKVVSILIVQKYLSPFYPPDDNMVQNPRGIYSCKSRHVETVITKADVYKLNYKWTSLLLLWVNARPLA
jgi:hypothetical protein